MTRSAFQFRSLVAIAVATMVVGAAFSASVRPAHAEDAVASAASRLTVEEVTVLKRRIAGWEGLEAAQQERIAQNVLHLRGLSPEAKARLLERTKRVDPLTLPGRMEKIEQFGPADRARWLQGRAFSKVIAAIVVQTLPPEARASFDPAARPPVLIDTERAQIEECVANAWMSAAKEQAMKLPPVDLDPSHGAPDGIASKFRNARDQVVRGGGASAAPSARRTLAEIFLQDRKMAAQRLVPRPEDDGDARSRNAHLKAMGAYLKEQFPEAFDTVAKAVAEAARTGRAGLLGLCDKQPGFTSFRDQQLVSVFMSLERSRREFEGMGGEALKHSDALQAAILSALEVPELDAQTFLSARGPERKMALMRIGVIRRLLGRK